MMVSMIIRCRVIRSLLISIVAFGSIACVEQFSPDEAQLEMEVASFYRAEAERNFESMLVHCYPCSGDQESIGHICNDILKHRQGWGTPERIGCEYKVYARYSSGGRIIRAKCKVKRRGVISIEDLAITAIFPSERKSCVKNFRIYSISRAPVD